MPTRHVLHPLRFVTVVGLCSRKRSVLFTLTICVNAAYVVTLGCRINCASYWRSLVSSLADQMHLGALKIQLGVPNNDNFFARSLRWWRQRFCSTHQATRHNMDLRFALVLTPSHRPATRLKNLEFYLRKEIYKNLLQREVLPLTKTNLVVTNRRRNGRAFIEKCPGSEIHGVTDHTHSLLVRFTV